jgi:hypothetical protein
LTTPFFKYPLGLPLVGFLVPPPLTSCMLWKRALLSTLPISSSLLWLIQWLPCLMRMLKRSLVQLLPGVTIEGTFLESISRGASLG